MESRRLLFFSPWLTWGIGIRSGEVDRGNQKISGTHGMKLLQRAVREVGSKLPEGWK